MRTASYVRFAVIGLVAIGAAGTLAISGSTPTHALCAAPPIKQGGYVNVDQNTRSIASARVRWGSCGDTNTSSSSPDTLSLWGRCHPRDCSFGRTTLRRAGQNMVATYNQSFAVRQIRVTQLAPDRIEIQMHTRFTDNSGRPPHTSIDVLHKVE